MSKKETFPRPGLQIRLAEKDGQQDITQIQIFKAGVFSHMYYGELNLTPAVFLAMVENFKNRVYDIDIMIDYDHECREAAAWIKELYLSEDQQELWARIEPTKEGQRCIDEKEYRYISGDFTFNYIDNERGLEYGPVLYGAALTNRPFLKGMAPTTELNEHGGNMTLQQLQDENKKLAEQVKAIQGEKEADAKKHAEDLAKKDSEIKTLSEKLTGLEKSAETAKKEAAFAVLLAEKKAVPAQKEAYLKGDMDEFLAKAAKLNETPAGTGASAEGDGTETESETEEDKARDEKIAKLAEEKFSKGGFNSFGAALSAAMKEVK